MTLFHALCLLASLGQADADSPFRTPVSLARAFDSLGYSFVPTSPNGVTGTLRRGDAVVQVGMRLSFGPSGEREASRVSSFDLSMEMDLPREIALADRVADSSAPTSTTPTRFVSHLGRTVTVSKRVVDERTTEQGLRVALDEYWRAGEAFARAYSTHFVPAVPRDRSSDRFPDGLVLDRADPVSLRRATDSWGWAARRNASIRANGWSFPLTVAGRALWLREAPLDSAGHDLTVSMGTEVDLPRGADVSGWVERAKARFEGAQFTLVGASKVRIEQAIDLSRGLTLGALRNRIQSFAERANADASSALTRLPPIL